MSSYIDQNLLIYTIRYVLRCVLIEFHAPCIDISMRNYSQLPTLLARATVAIGLFISLGVEFSNRGIDEMDEEIIPKLRCVLERAIIPRVLPSYALLFWFTLEVQCNSSCQFQNMILRCV